MTTDFTGLTDSQLKARGAEHTAREIARQPTAWRETTQLIESKRSALDEFLAPLLAEPNLRVVLTGAGTSAFAAQILVPELSLKLGRTVEAVPTTDIVSGPHLYLRPRVPTLLISLGRSGGSPESMATVDLAEQLVRDVHHLVITCNPAGELVRKCEGARNAFVLVLPDSAHDRGFAVTASFSSMLLSVALIFNVLDPARVDSIGRAAARALTTAASLARTLAARGFKRVVYLGSNELGTLASEAALKLLELADGQVIALGYSSLQFRHGPKCVIDGDTLVVMLLSNHEHARAYDRDLLVELRRNARAGEIVALGSRIDDLSAEKDIVYADATSLSVLELVLVHVVFAQAHGLAHSLALGLTPDKPNAAGLVNRVVQGVTIHPWKHS